MLYYSKALMIKLSLHVCMETLDHHHWSDTPKTQSSAPLNPFKHSKLWKYGNGVWKYEQPRGKDNVVHGTKLIRLT